MPPDPECGLSSQERRAISAHMNDDHADVVLLYVRVFGGFLRAQAARMIDIDETGMELEATLPSGLRRVRVTFTQRLQSAGDARRVLIQMAQSARQTQGPKQ